MYLTLNHLCFYAPSLISGPGTKLALRYSDIVDITQGTQSVTVATHNGQHYKFVSLFNASAMYRLLQQLSQITMRSILQDPDQANVGNVVVDPAMVLQAADGLANLSTSGSSAAANMLISATPAAAATMSASSTSNVSLLRSLNARKRSDEYRRKFRLPLSEQLDGQINGEYELRCHWECIWKRWVELLLGAMLKLCFI